MGPLSKVGADEVRHGIRGFGVMPEDYRLSGQRMVCLNGAEAGTECVSLVGCASTLQYDNEWQFLGLPIRNRIANSIYPFHIGVEQVVRGHVWREDFVEEAKNFGI
jgi:hypothetical protein